MRDYAELLEQRLMLAARAEAQRGWARRLWRATLARQVAWLAVVGTTSVAAASVAAVLLTAGAAPSVAQALPILAEPATDVSTGVDLPGRRWLRGADLADARAFMLPYGTGYVIPNADNTTLCVMTPELVIHDDGWASGPPPGGVDGGVTGACGVRTATVEQHGYLLTWYLTSSAAMFVGVLPVDANASLTNADGTTAEIPITDGIATAVVHQNVTVSVHIGGLTRTLQFGPSTPSVGGNDTVGAPSPPYSSIDTQPASPYPTPGTNATGPTGSTGSTTTTGGAG